MGGNFSNGTNAVLVDGPSEGKRKRIRMGGSTMATMRLEDGSFLAYDRGADGQMYSLVLRSTGALPNNLLGLSEVSRTRYDGVL